MADNGGAPLERLDCSVHDWEQAEERANDNWRGLIAGAIRNHESSLDVIVDART
jgi:hypothetical protein